MRIKPSLVLLSLGLISAGFHLACNNQEPALPTMVSTAPTSDDANGTVHANIPVPSQSGPPSPSQAGPGDAKELPLPGQSSPAGPGDSKQLPLPGQSSPAGPGAPTAPGAGGGGSGGGGGGGGTATPTAAPTATPVPAATPTPTTAAVVLTFSSSDTPKAIPFLAVTQSNITVTGAPAATRLARVRIAFVASFTDTSKVNQIDLVSPPTLSGGGTLSALVYGITVDPALAGQGFGTSTSCSFSGGGSTVIDSAISAPELSAGSSPYAGSFGFDNFESNAAARFKAFLTDDNGSWALRFNMTSSTGTVPTLTCWMLELQYTP
jgi:hypothetical protein